ncbi:signal peptide peptidase-like 2A [Ornithodoros turicata]|uniref:signal peptide peptidase-like 2A n=1 Tax=Ornithodoros turicata TaxID=34597 RepID=UPI0031391977
MCTLRDEWCRMMKVALVVLFFFINRAQSAEYAVITADVDNEMHQYCMVYFSEFKELPENPDKMGYMQLVNLTSQDGCKKLRSVNLHGKIALIKQTNNCTFDKVVLHYKAAHAYGIISATPRTRVDGIIFDSNDTRHLGIVVGFVPDTTAVSLLSLMKPKQPLMVKMFTKKNLAFDFSLVIIWVVAVFTVAVGSYWSGLVKHELYQHEVGRCTSTTHATEGDDRTVSKAENPLDEESSLNVSPILVTLFVICMGAMLLLLYFFFQYLVFFIIGMFALASVVSIIGVLEPFIYMIPIGTTRIPKTLCPCFHGPLEIRQLALIMFAISLSVSWVVLRHHSQSWILQDLLGVAFSINMLKTLRLPSLMICTVLLVLLFFYDIFFVFITPFLTMKGDSIMVEVAKGGGSQEQLPMVLRVPHFSNEALAVCLSQYSLLGFGDILVPGLLVAYCHGFDLVAAKGRYYYLTSTFFYGVGLVATFMALYMMKMAQPALLYLVPATLVPTVCLALFRGQFSEIWHGVKPPVNASTAAAAAASGNIQVVSAGCPETPSQFVNDAVSSHSAPPSPGPGHSMEAPLLGPSHRKMHASSRTSGNTPSQAPSNPFCIPSQTPSNIPSRANSPPHTPPHLKSLPQGLAASNAAGIDGIGASHTRAESSKTAKQSKSPSAKSLYPDKQKGRKNTI